MERKRFSVRQIPGLLIATVMGYCIAEDGSDPIRDGTENDGIVARKTNGNGAVHDTAYTNTPNGQVARRAMKRTHPSGK